MKIKQTIISLVAATAFATAPVASASAHEWHHGYGGYRGGLIIGAGAAVVGAAVALATLPFRVVADVAAPPPAPVYAAPAYVPAAYSYPPGYYYRPHRVVYAYPQQAYGYYGAPAYAVPPGY